MSINLTMEELRKRLDKSVDYRQAHLTGDEKGEAAIFLENLFQAFGNEGVRQAGATLEKRIKKRDNAGTAYADLEWKPRVLIEMKKAGRDLAKDYRQAFEYWIDLVPDRPAYVVLCNFDEFWVYDLNSQLEEPVDRIRLEDLPKRWEALAFLLPVEEKPTFGNDLVAVTRETAAMVSAVFNRLVQRGVDRGAAQRFILQAVMAMFSEDIGLLPRHFFTQAIEDVLEKQGTAYDLLFGLFREMNTPGITSGGRFADTPYFNGGLYATVEPFDLKTEEVTALGLACQENWAAVRPVIFGTLFEQSLDKPERHAYGAYFTSEADIQKVVLPTIVRPWRERIEQANTLEELGQVEQEMLAYRVLDPACGSGNFLYVAYRELRRLEKQLHEKRVRRSREADRSEALRFAFVSTKQFYGIDLRPFAVEVAKVTLMLARKLAADELGEGRSGQAVRAHRLETLNPTIVDWSGWATTAPSQWRCPQDQLRAPAWETGRPRSSSTAGPACPASTRNRSRSSWRTSWTRSATSSEGRSRRLWASPTPSKRTSRTPWPCWTDLASSAPGSSAIRGVGISPCTWQRPEVTACSG
jgi:hypothetical protein